MEKKKVSKPKKQNTFNRGPINPPKDWKPKEVLPSYIFRVISR